MATSATSFWAASRVGRLGCSGTRPAGLAGLVLWGLLLGGCAAGPQVSANPGGDGLTARQALAVRKAEGPVLAIIEGQPFDQSEAARDAEVTGALAAGIRGLDVRFTTDPAEVTSPEPHLVVLLDPLGVPSLEQACARPATIPMAPAGEELRVVVAFCQGDQAIGTARGEDTVAGPDDRRFRRLLWRTAGALFPDEYAESYGFDLLPGIDFGVGGSFGF